MRIDRKEGYDRVILGGEDHRHELPLDPEKAYKTLEEYFKKILPDIAYEIVNKWNGPILETIDGLPYIGTYDNEQPNLFVATGYSGSGMTFGTIAGKMFSEFAQNKEVSWEDLYDPKRPSKPLNVIKKGIDYVEEFVEGYGHTVFKSVDDDKK